MRTRSDVCSSASSSIASRQAQKSPPSVRPRSARWKAWLCALTKPGIVSRFATRRRYQPRGPSLEPVPPTSSPMRSYRGKAHVSVTKVEQMPSNRSASALSLTTMSAPAVSAPLARVPNALTILRLVLIPVFVALLIPADGGYSWPAAIVFGVAGITDQVDGWLARRWHVESAFGKVADPLADRLMIDAAVIILVARPPPPAVGRPRADRRAGRAAHRRVQAARAPRLRAQRQLPGQGSRPGCCTRPSLRDGHPRGHAVAALVLLDRPRARARRRSASTRTRP